MKFVVGIGNPGRQHEKTRHNIGFRVLDALVSAKKLKWDSKLEWHAWVADYNEETILVKPDTFVNRTNDSLAAMPHAEPSDYLIVSDDVNLNFGKLRLRRSGSAGGHHGLEAAIAGLETEDFPRLRIGVGNALMPKDLAGFVLEPFDPAEQKALSEIIKRAASICETWVNQSFEKAQDRLSQLQSSEKEWE